MLSVNLLIRFNLLDDRGLTLLEVLVSMALLSVALLGFAGFSTVAIQSAGMSKKMTTAVALAQEKMEEVRLKGYRRHLITSASATEPYGTIPHAPLHARTVVIHPNRPIPGLQTVKVTILWDNDAHAIEMVTLVAE